MDIIPDLNMQAIEQQLKLLEDAQVKVSQMKSLIAKGAAENEVKNKAKSEEGINPALWSRKKSSVKAKANRGSHAINIVNPLSINGFESKITEALEILEKRDLEGYKLVRENTQTISSSTRSGAAYWAKQTDIQESDLRNDDGWLAGVLVHEAKHNERRNKNGKIDYCDNTEEEELDCISVQIETMKNIGGESYLIQGLRKEKGDHFRYQ